MKTYNVVRTCKEFPSGRKRYSMEVGNYFEINCLFGERFLEVGASFMDRFDRKPIGALYIPYISMEDPHIELAVSAYARSSMATSGHFKSNYDEIDDLGRIFGEHIGIKYVPYKLEIEKVEAPKVKGIYRNGSRFDYNVSLSHIIDSNIYTKFRNDQWVRIVNTEDLDSFLALLSMSEGSESSDIIECICNMYSCNLSYYYIKNNSQI